MNAANPAVVRRLLAVALGAALLLLVTLAVLIVRQLSAEALPPLTAAPAPADPALVARGAYLARAGNCAACHTARGGLPYAGGRGIDTPFGTVFAGNLTPDPEHGLGRWSADAFWRALHHGQSRDGRLLYPAFPYTSFTQISREDSDALHAFLRSLPPVAMPNRPHALRFPYRTQAALAVWRALYFEPGGFQPDPTQPADWNRGAYLVRGLAHCAACHAPRDALGGVAAGREFDGGLMAGQGWYAPSLRSRFEAGLADWAAQDIVDLLKTGVAHGGTGAAKGAAMGPMAEVVFHSTQHLSDADLRAMARYLRGLGPDAAAPPPAAPRAASAQLTLGQRVYEAQCTDCHGAQGEGARQAYPPLAGNRALTLASAVNPVQAVLNGGFAPATAGNPRPYGMPPYRTLLSDAEIAAVITYARQSWGNQAAAVSPLEVQRLR
ncbi:MAG: alcohol dehydrogenase [Burkholderiales bacterium RIFCSPHIGHO2_12_FULL_67_38]|nr:MAG: alcohol dehydrogenase [Burkholderiales bacterium RIFCSPLOWO2_02_FULL_67_64]OGB37497.1 MAG: alcohol dehydrogenase [Burkholderiales bacterium RIFCSPHIGHO2_12_FULL_67_38]